MTIYPEAIFETYAEVNAVYAVELDPDVNVEQYVCVIAVWKWSDSGLSPDDFDVSFLGLEVAEHVRASDKLDLFICDRG